MMDLKNFNTNELFNELEEAKLNVHTRIRTLKRELEEAQQELVTLNGATATIQTLISKLEDTDG